MRALLLLRCPLAAGYGAAAASAGAKLDAEQPERLSGLVAGEEAEKPHVKPHMRR